MVRFSWKRNPELVKKYIRWYGQGHTLKEIVDLMKPYYPDIRIAQVNGLRKDHRLGKWDNLEQEVALEDAVPPIKPVIGQTPEWPPYPIIPLKHFKPEPQWPDYPIIPIQPIFPIPGPTGAMDEDEYSPEGNVDDNSVGSDPSCKEVFKLKSTPDTTPLGSGLDRMKRVKVYTAVKPGSGPFPYTFYNPGQRVFTEITTITRPPDDYMVFEGVHNIHWEPDETGARKGVPIPAPGTILVGANVVDDNGNSVRFKLEHDELDNWYLSLREDIPGNDVTLNFDVACPVLSRNYWSDVKKFHDANLPLTPASTEVVESSIHDTAKDLALFVNLETGSGLKKVIDVLGLHCAMYSCGLIPPGDMLVESFKNQVGSCRHRVMGFFIVAGILGVPARYAISDCHAYIELLDPKYNSWTALDLGGCDPGGPRNPSDLSPPSPAPPPPGPPGEPPDEKPPEPSPPTPPEPSPPEPSPPSPPEPSPPSPPEPSPPPPEQPPTPPTTPDDEMPPPPERPEDRPQADIRDIWRQAGIPEEDIQNAFLAWKRSGGK